MQLPNSSQAYIQTNRLIGYLLPETHEVGKAKAKFFKGLGFSNTNPKPLEEALLNLARTQVIDEVIQMVHGTKYTITGSIQTPSGKTVFIL
ncbi:MAG: DUF6883 domain-containing protein [Cyanobacteria bacterium J06642_2]